MATKTMPSPFANGMAEEIQKTDIFEMRGQQIQVTVPVFRCIETGEQFTTDEQDELFLELLEQKWREHNHVPTAEQLTARREALGLSAREASRLLGFGVNQFRQYESGELPSESNALLLGMFCDHSMLGKLLQMRLAALPSKTVRKLQELTHVSALGREITTIHHWPRHAAVSAMYAPSVGRVHSGSAKRQAAKRPAIADAWAMPGPDLVQPAALPGWQAAAVIYGKAPRAEKSTSYLPIVS
ncbi:type II TA system antitoxin MqsA family protein [Hymenobacter armeniacus]|nr:type II TA system antitoxin MqsA family protein [Hymenobacter armeniacus]